MRKCDVFSTLCFLLLHQFLLASFLNSVISAKPVKDVIFSLCFSPQQTVNQCSIGRIIRLAIRARVSKKKMAAAYASSSSDTVRATCIYELATRIPLSNYDLDDSYEMPTNLIAILAIDGGVSGGPRQGSIINSRKTNTKKNFMKRILIGITTGLAVS